MTPTIDTLLERVYRHHPRGLAPDDSDPDQLKYQSREEYRRLVCVQEAAAKSCQWGFYDVPDDQRVAIDPDVQAVVDALRAWRPFAARWRERFPDLLLWDESNPWHDASYRYAALQPGYVPPRTISSPGDEKPAEPPPPSASDPPEPIEPVPHDPVMCVVSSLAPVYAIYTYDRTPDTVTKIRYAEFPARYHDRVGKLCALAEEMFGFTRLGEGLLLHPVPDVVPFSANLCLGEATLMDCLFTASP